MRVCHTDVTFVVERVEIIQASVHETLLATEDALVAAIHTIQAAAAATNVNAALLDDARQLHRLGQARWILCLPRTAWASTIPGGFAYAGSCYRPGPPGRIESCASSRLSGDIE